MEFRVRLKDINALNIVEITTIYTRLSHPDSEIDSSIRPELERRYLAPAYGPHPAMTLAIVWLDDVLVGWVGTRPWREKFKGDTITVQTIECFVDPAYRRRGLASLGLQALVSAGVVRRNEPVAVYAADAVNVAKQCGCKTVLLRNAV